MVHEKGDSQGVRKKGGSREPCDLPGYGLEHQMITFRTGEPT